MSSAGPREPAGGGQDRGPDPAGRGHDPVERRRREPSVLEHLEWSFVMVLATLAVAAVSIWLLRLAGCQNELSRG